MDRRQVLIVDDYPGAVYLRSRILNDAGYETLEATNGEDALRIATERLPALILLDVNLPDISGPEVCERLRQDPRTAAIPIVQITGAWLSEDDRRRGMASGANAYLIEPIDDNTLIKTVVSFIESET